MWCECFVESKAAIYGTTAKDCMQLVRAAIYPVLEVTAQQHELQYAQYSRPVTGHSYGTVDLEIRSLVCML